MCQHYLFCRVAFVNRLHAYMIWIKLQKTWIERNVCFYNISDLSTISKTNMTEIMRKRIDVLRENWFVPVVDRVWPLYQVEPAFQLLLYLSLLRKLVSSKLNHILELYTDGDFLLSMLWESALLISFCELSDKMILVTRNPWTRIYSAYMDKVYRLQVDYIKQIKRMANIIGNYCGEIPTFEQFLQFIVVMNSRRRKLDPHWRPISTLYNLFL
jgi:hypothetical protein